MIRNFWAWFIDEDSEQLGRCLCKSEEQAKSIGEVWKQLYSFIKRTGVTEVVE